LGKKNVFMLQYCSKQQLSDLRMYQMVLYTECFWKTTPFRFFC